MTEEAVFPFQRYGHYSRKPWFLWSKINLLMRINPYSVAGENSGAMVSYEFLFNKGEQREIQVWTKDKYLITRFSVWFSLHLLDRHPAIVHCSSRNLAFKKKPYKLFDHEKLLYHLICNYHYPTQLLIKCCSELIAYTTW